MASGFNKRKGMYLPYNVQLPNGGLAGGVGTGAEIINPSGSKGEYCKQPFYFFSSDFRAYGQLNRGNWDSK